MIKTIDLLVAKGASLFAVDADGYEPEDLAPDPQVKLYIMSCMEKIFKNAVQQSDYLIVTPKPIRPMTSLILFQDVQASPTIEDEGIVLKQPGKIDDKKLASRLIDNSTKARLRRSREDTCRVPLKKSTEDLLAKEQIALLGAKEPVQKLKKSR